MTGNHVELHQRLPESALAFVEGPVNAEDLARVPGTRWLIGSGMASIGHPQGHLYLIDTVARKSEELFPGQVEIRSPAAPYDQVGPPDVASFNAHGLSLRPGSDGIHTLYVVNHGGREAIEVFEVDATEDHPSVSWVGAVLQDTNVWGNAVAHLPDGGIVATNYLSLVDPAAFDKVYSGLVTGNLKEWHPGGGWEDVPGSEFSAPNGVEVSPDGRWYFVNSWSTRTFVRLSRGTTPVQRDRIDVDFLPDNVKWSSDGQVLITGQVSEPAEVFDGFNSRDICNYPLIVLKIDPDTLRAVELARYSHERFGTASTALEVGDELWISSPRSDCVAFLPRMS
jgi:WD40 repeat protein